MKKILSLLAITAIITACGNQQKEIANEKRISAHKTLEGDSTRFGLACEGCTDSILIFLPHSANRLDTFDIITARQHGQIFGRPHIGDEIAITLNPADTMEVVTLINLEELRDTWYYMVKPKLKQPDDMPTRIQKRMKESIPDSLMKEWMKPMEYTLAFKNNNTAMARRNRARRSSEDMIPVEYPRIKYYTEWYLYNGKIILKADTINGFSQPGEKPSIDTVSIELLMRDSMVLKFPDHEQSFYRKKKTDTK